MKTPKNDLKFRNSFFSNPNEICIKGPHPQISYVWYAPDQKNLLFVSFLILPRKTIMVLTVSALSALSFLVLHNTWGGWFTNPPFLQKIHSMNAHITKHGRSVNQLNIYLLGTKSQCWRERHQCFPLTSSILRGTWQKNSPWLWIHILRIENHTGLDYHSFCC